MNIINNVVHDNTNIGIDYYGNAGYCSVPALDQPRYCVAAGNEIYNSICSYAECAGLYVDGARDIVLENNISHGNMYGIEIGSEEGHRTTYAVKNIIARNNLVYNNSSGGIRVGGYDKKNTGYVTDTKIYNNTLVNNGEGEGGWNGEFCFVKCNGIDVKNNIVYKDSTKYPMIGGDLPKEYVLNVTFSNNVYYNPLGAEEIYFEFPGGSAEGIGAFNLQTGGSDVFGKPDFNSDYSLKQGSYGIDMGTDVSADMGMCADLAGNYRIINTIDAGAFEYQDGSKPTVSTTTTETTTETTTSYVTKMGDVNKDGNVDNADSAAILKILSKLITDFTNYDLDAMDFNNDGNKDILDAIAILNKKLSVKLWNYTVNENTDSFCTVANANEKKGAEVISYNGLSLTKAIKMESKTSISFTAAEAGKLTLITSGSASSKIKVNNVSYNIVPGGELVVDVPAGVATVTKDSPNVNLYYMSYQ